jgi:hypothetical protein
MSDLIPEPSGDMPTLPGHKLSAAMSYAMFGDCERAGKAAGVTSRSIRNWLKTEEFLRAVEHCKRAAVGTLAEDLRNAGPMALATVLDVMKNADADRDRLAAAKLVIDKLTPDLVSTAGKVEVEHSGGVRVIRVTEAQKTSASKRLRAQGRQMEEA